MIQTQEQRCKELDEKCNKIEKDVERETKERIVDQQSKFKKLKVTLDKVIKTLNQDAKVIIIQYKQEYITITCVLLGYKHLHICVFCCIKKYTVIMIPRIASSYNCIQKIGYNSKINIS